MIPLKLPIRRGVIVFLAVVSPNENLVSGSTSPRSMNPRSPAQDGEDTIIRVAWAGSSRADMPYPLVHVHFCLGCPDPSSEGSLVTALAPHHGLQDFRVFGELVYAVPNDCRSGLLNAEDVHGQVLLVNRGEVSIVQKVLTAQAAGARGVLIIDLEIENGGCEDGFAFCGRLGGALDGGFAQRDGGHTWAAVTLPAVLISASQGKRLIDMMPRLQRMVVEGYGEQFVAR